MRRLVVTAVVGMLLLGVAGCATRPAASPTSAPSDAPSDGASADVVNEVDRVDAAWLAGGTLLAVVTYGSSSCAPRVDDVVADAGALLVTLTPAEEDVCTDDLTPRALAVGVPAGIDVTKDVAVQVTRESGAVVDLELAPAVGDAEEFMPSAAWLREGSFALLTWGSSSCTPTIESAVASTPEEVVVTFAPVQADQVCTMDMAPQISVATVQGDVSADATLSLGLDGGSSIPIR